MHATPRAADSPATIPTGYVAPGFEEVRDAFALAASVDDLGGSALSIVRGDTTLVDLVAGSADPRSGRAWEPDTPSVVFSVSKAVLAILALKLIEAGELGLDSAVARYWPEFAQADKAEITVRDVLAHRAGLMALDADLTAEDILAVSPVLRAIEVQTPLWTPGTAFGYHALTYGWIVGEILRRVSGANAGDLVRELIAEALGGADITLGASDDVLARRALLLPPLLESPLPIDVTPSLQEALQAATAPEAMRSLSMGSAIPDIADPAALVTALNEPEFLRAGVPAAGVMASARALARMFAATVREGDALLCPRSRQTALRSLPDVPWWGGLAPRTARFTTGFLLNNEADRRMLSPTSFGHDGAIGQLAFADVESGIGFAWATNRQVGLVAATRSTLIVDALRACVRRD
ncbi:serine hydrolase domain-containing protein [Microbacterium sp. QXD-8]|uniref:Serine hydrolase domain-containing protein n=1 Tax=Microbacterium psychrotolerans TaxID=3068321 RepID=A0ABU0YXL8_9MICO|nr:serine hydrolase domain-containing protein [Microbacterium sp. QXD-8]MDQ7876525.1 serine hydrolase domain-containing protein [Microbacterium sp. QXD-8]